MYTSLFIFMGLSAMSSFMAWSSIPPFPSVAFMLSSLLPTRLLSLSPRSPSPFPDSNGPRICSSTPAHDMFLVLVCSESSFPSFSILSSISGILVIPIISSLLIALSKDFMFRKATDLILSIKYSYSYPPRSDAIQASSTPDAKKVKFRQLNWSKCKLKHFPHT